jgi:hypothetical protein
MIDNMIEVAKAELKIKGDSMWAAMVECGFPIRDMADADTFDWLVGVVDGFSGPFAIFDLMDICNCSYGHASHVIYDLHRAGLLKKVSSVPYCLWSN